MPAHRVQVDPDILKRLRAICRALPETREEHAWTGVRWRVRKDTFAHVLVLEGGWPPAYAKAAGRDGPATLLTFRSWDREFDPPEFAAAPFAFQPRRAECAQPLLSYATALPFMGAAVNGIVIERDRTFMCFRLR